MSRDFANIVTTVVKECGVRQHDGWGGIGVMVWAGITANFRTLLVITEQYQTPDTFDAQVLYCMCANGGNTRY